MVFSGVVGEGLPSLRGKPYALGKPYEGYIHETITAYDDDLFQHAVTRRGTIH